MKIKYEKVLDALLAAGCIIWIAKSDFMLVLPLMGAIYGIVEFKNIKRNELQKKVEEKIRSDLPGLVESMKGSPNPTLINTFSWSISRIMKDNEN